MASRTDRQLREFGDHLRGWRMVLGLTARQVSERADISVTTLRNLERGDGSVSLGATMAVARALGQLEGLVDALDPLHTDIGRARASELNRKRAR